MTAAPGYFLREAAKSPISPVSISGKPAGSGTTISGRSSNGSSIGPSGGSPMGPIGSVGGPCPGGLSPGGAVFPGGGACDARPTGMSEPGNPPPGINPALPGLPSGASVRLIGEPMGFVCVPVAPVSPPAMAETMAVVKFPALALARVLELRFVAAAKACAVWAPGAGRQSISIPGRAMPPGCPRVGQSCAVRRRVAMGPEVGWAPFSDRLVRAGGAIAAKAVPWVTPRRYAVGVKAAVVIAKKIINAKTSRRFMACTRHL